MMEGFYFLSTDRGTGPMIRHVRRTSKGMRKKREREHSFFIKNPVRFLLKNTCIPFLLLINKSKKGIESCLSQQFHIGGFPKGIFPLFMK